MCHIHSSPNIYISKLEFVKMKPQFKPLCAVNYCVAASHYDSFGLDTLDCAGVLSQAGGDRFLSFSEQRIKKFLFHFFLEIECN